MNFFSANNKSKNHKSNCPEISRQGYRMMNCCRKCLMQRTVSLLSDYGRVILLQIHLTVKLIWPFVPIYGFGQATKPKLTAYFVNRVCIVKSGMRNIMATVK